MVSSREVEMYISASLLTYGTLNRIVTGVRTKRKSRYYDKLNYSSHYVVVQERYGGIYEAVG